MIAADATTGYSSAVAIVAPLMEHKRGLDQYAFAFAQRPTSATTTEYGPFADQYSRLNRVAKDQSLWPSNIAPEPNAIDWSRQVLNLLETIRFRPSKIVATADGGMAVCFVRGNKYADIESLNSGTILGVVSNRRDRPTVWHIEPSPRGIAHAAIRIRDFIQG